MLMSINAIFYPAWMVVGLLGLEDMKKVPT